MKLVDILARELKVWPEDSSCDYCCQSDSSTEVFFGHPAGSIFLSERADETKDVEVTRAQWQAAVDALKVDEEAVPEWNGEGLPPVGAVCEAGIPHVSGLKNETISVIWIECRVIAYHVINGKTYAWIAEDDGFYAPGIFEFRPIRTPEQIAADEIQKIRNEIKWQKPQLGPCPVEQMYLLGYRKFEIVDN